MGKRTKLVLLGYEGKRKDPDGVWRLVGVVETLFKTIEAVREAGAKKIVPRYKRS